MCLAANLFSCNGKQKAESGLIPTEEEAVDTIATDSAVQEAPGYQEMEASKYLDRNFDDFMYAFVRSPHLQRKRVLYPLPVSLSDSTAEPLNYLDCTSEFSFMNGDFYTVLFGKVSQIEEVKEAEESRVSVERISLMDMDVSYFDFERRDGKWMLVGTGRRPASEYDCYDFLNFYSQFSSDSLFQLRHIANPLRFSMMDPEEEETYIEGTLSPQQWFSFCPDVPAGVISNIRYGQTYQPHHMVLQKCGLANGMQETFTFDRRNSKWQLTSYEN